VQETNRFFDVFVKNENYYSRRSPADLISRESFFRGMHDFEKSLRPFYDPAFQKGKNEEERSKAKMIKRGP
jgi:hypothetical protein